MKTFDFRKKSMQNLKKLMYMEPSYAWILNKPTYDMINSMRVGQVIMEYRKNRRKYEWL